MGKNGIHAIMGHESAGSHDFLYAQDCISCMVSRRGKMKLKTRLIISFCIIIFVPMGLMACSLYGFQRFQLREIAQTYGMGESSDYTYLTNSTQLLNRYTKQICQELLTVAEEDTVKLEDFTYLEEMNSRLLGKYSFLLVRKDNAIIFKGGGDAKISADTLPAYGEGDASPDSRYFLNGDTQSLVKQIDFIYEDNSQGSLFVVTSIQGLLPEMKGLLIDVIISVLLILVLTAAMLTIWIYKGIIGPIKKLETAAQNIKEGNLDFEVEAEKEDEIGSLCNNFEQMRKRLKESTEEKLVNEKESKALISNIAHDLKTPITAVKGYAEGLLDGVADTPEKMDKYIRTIYNKANEIDLLLNELTLYSKIDTNRIPYNFNKINVAEYFDDCIEEIGLDLEAKNIGLSYFNYAEDDILIIADPEQLKRVIHNIIGNSIKYLDKSKGFINIRVKDVGDFIQVEIEDNGKGIAARDLPYIFDRFYRADSSRNSATGGSGIGLSIVKKIIEDHGGKIWATSKEATGTIMYLVLRKYQEVINE